MKNIKYIFAALVAFAALSCNKLEAPVENPDADLMTLVLSTGKQTKTHISDVTTNGVTEIHWDAGDMIRVFTDVEYQGLTNNGAYDKNATSFSMDGNPNGNFARFGGKVPAKSSKFWTVYPASSAKTCSAGGNGSDIIASIPSSQNPFANSFAPNLNISVAKGAIKETDNGTLGYGDYQLTETILVNFKNVCSLLKFTAPAEADQIESVVITADKAIVGDLTINYSGDNPQVTGVSGGNSITMNGPFAANTDYYFVLAPVAISDLSVYVNTSDNKQYSATKTFGNDSQLQLKPGQYKSLGTLNFNNMPSFSVDFDIQDDGGFLSGTDVILTFPTDEVLSIDLTVSQKNGSAVRKIHISDPDIDSNGKYIAKYSDDETWPYLPKGTYTISGTYLTAGGAVSVNAELNIDANPNFNVGSFNCFTSYTKYKSGTTTAVTDANKCDGASIYIEQIGGISESITNNSNYAAYIKAKFNNGNEITASYHKDVERNKFSMPAYRQYTSAVIIFDSVVSSAISINCHVTGIPYTLKEPNSNDSVAPWSTVGTGDRIKWSNALVLGELAGSMAAEKIFDLPSNITVDVTAKGSVTGRLKGLTGWLAQDTTGSISVSGENLFSLTVKPKGTYSNPDTQNFNLTKTMTLKSETPKITCSLSDGTSPANITLTELRVIYK